MPVIHAIHDTPPPPSMIVHYSPWLKSHHQYPPPSIKPNQIIPNKTIPNHTISPTSISSSVSLQFQSIMPYCCLAIFGRSRLWAIFVLFYYVLPIKNIELWNLAREALKFVKTPSIWILFLTHNQNSFSILLRVKSCLEFFSQLLPSLEPNLHLGKLTVFI